MEGSIRYITTQALLNQASLPSVFFLEAPIDSVLPYAVISLRSLPVTRDTGHIFETYKVDIALYSKIASNLDEMALSVKVTFDDNAALFVIPGYKCDRISRGALYSSAADGVYQYVIPYTLDFTK